jgi:RNA polymerase sigma-70 factor (ECF subfamily)
MRFDTAEKEQFERTAVVHAASRVRVAERLLGDRSAAEDAVQETLLSGWRSFDQFQRYTNGRAWLFKIMLRIIGKHRRRQLTLPIVKLPEGNDFDNMFPIPTASIETNSELLAPIGSFTPGRSERTALSVADGFTSREISTMLDLPIGTRSRRPRGRFLRLQLVRGRRSTVGSSGSIDRSLTCVPNMINVSILHKAR